MPSLLAQEGELYVLAQSRDRVAKDRAMRRRQLKRLWARLKQLSTMQLTREELLMKLGAARDQSRTAWGPELHSAVLSSRQPTKHSAKRLYHKL